MLTESLAIFICKEKQIAFECSFLLTKFDEVIPPQIYFYTLRSLYFLALLTEKEPTHLVQNTIDASLEAYHDASSLLL